VWFTNRDGSGWTTSTFPLEAGADYPFDFTITPGDLLYPKVVQAGDFNGDGLMDLVVFRGTGVGGYDTDGNGIYEFGIDIDVHDADIHVYLSTGRNFYKQDSFTRQTGLALAPFAIDYPGNQDLSLLARLGDINGDGRTDLIIFDPTYQRKAHVLFSDGRQFRDDVVWGTGFGVIDQDIIADIDGDGRADAVQITPIGEFHVTLAGK